MAKKTTKAKTARFEPRVHVRMYCQGLGDCFLVRFETEENTFFDLLIDCGIYKASPDAGDLMNLVVDDIIETTKDAKNKNGHLNLLVVTHEHWDHISGFAQALPKFKAMTIDRTWQAWTEDESEPVAKDLLKKFKKSKAALVGAMRDADKRPGAAKSQALTDAFQVMGFFGVDKKGDEDDAYTKIKAMLAEKNLEFLSPGIVELIDDTGVQIFVLGPPKSVAAIGKDDPGAKDGYHKQKTALFQNFDAKLGAVLSGMNDDVDVDDQTRPFNESHAIPVDLARQTDFFQNLYGFDDGHPEYFRSIDDMAYETLGNLALRLDSHINNTSLVLALKLPSGDVLLFPGDAQAGNWKSWADLKTPLEFTVKKEGKTEKTNAHELLAATVFYKVGHHGSHNATPKTYGLELMTNPRLRALVPVDHTIAVGAGYGEMPLIEIMEALKTRTEGAVFRSDGDPMEPPKGIFNFSKKTLPIRTKKDGEAIERSLFCETTFPLH